MKSLPYFAFGSNMSKKQLKERGIEWNEAFSASLSDYRLVFNKTASSNDRTFANIEKLKNSKVYGILYYGLTEKDYERLDHFEGVREEQYKREKVNVRIRKGENEEVIETITYIAGEKWIDRTGELKPSKNYIDKLWEGKDYLPLDYQEILKDVEVMEGEKYRGWLNVEEVGQKEQQSQILQPTNLPPKK